LDEPPTAVAVGAHARAEVVRAEVVNE
jgi:hypothetical protein